MEKVYIIIITYIIMAIFGCWLINIFDYHPLFYGGCVLLGLSYYGISKINDKINIKLIKDLKVSNKKYQTIFSNAPRLITLVYRNGYMKDCNDRIKDILGYEKEEVVGKETEKVSMDIEMVGKLLQLVREGKL